MKTPTRTIQGRVAHIARLTAALTIAGLSLAACATAPPPEPTFPISRAPAVLTPTARSQPAPQPVQAKPAVEAKAKAKAVETASEGARARRPLDRRYKVGSPYKIAGTWYRPAANSAYDEVGMASWYGDEFNGKATANGERFNMHSASAAHTTLPLPSIIEVTNLENGRSIQVRLNDRGPFKNGRIIDLSRQAAQQLGYMNKGLARVRVRYVGPARFDGSANPLYVAQAPLSATGKVELAALSTKAKPRAERIVPRHERDDEEAMLQTIAYNATRPPNIDEWLRSGRKPAPLW